jgi:hypothetical protein
MVRDVRDRLAGIAVYAYPAWARGAAALLVVASRAALAAILVLVVVANDPPVTPPVLLRLFGLFAAGPALAAWLLGRALAARLEVSAEDVVVRRRDLRVEVPRDAVTTVVPWAIPLPGPGLTLGLRSGRRLRPRLGAADPSVVIEALAAGGVAAAGRATTHPTVLYAHARAGAGGARWPRLAAKYVLFAAGPAAVLFNAHQHIAYGGTFGQYYLLGLGAYLTTLAVYWGTLAIYLVLYGGTLRVAAEAVALLAAWVAPSRAARVRPAVELANRVLYYGGVPVLLLLRFAS